MSKHYLFNVKKTTLIQILIYSLGHSVDRITVEAPPILTLHFGNRNHFYNHTEIMKKKENWKPILTLPIIILLSFLLPILLQKIIISL